MNHIKVKSLSLINFKGIRKLNLEGLGHEVHIFGDNGTGKTTVFDAFTWLLFGKDSADRTTFEIKTLDASGLPIPKIEHEVSAVLEINGENTEIKRVLREKWVTKRGSSDAEFSGNETVFFWNDVPVNASEFSKKINGIVDEKLFKLITNPLAFNALKWQDRRNVLIDMVGEVSEADIAQGNEDFQNLLSKLSNKTLEEYKKQVAASLKKMKTELKVIPTRIDEVERGKPQAADFKSIRTKINDLQGKLEAIEAQLRDKVEADQALTNQKRAIRSKVNDAEDRVSEIQRSTLREAKEFLSEGGSEKESILSKLSAIEDELQSAARTKASITAQKEDRINETKKLKTRNKELGEEWHKESEATFKMDENDCQCPTCKREFEASDIEAKQKELEGNFNTNKRQRLEAINDRGQANSVNIKAYQKEAEDLDFRLEKGAEIITDLNDKRNQLKQSLESAGNSSRLTLEEKRAELLSANTEIPELRTKIKNLEQELTNLKPADTSDLEAQKRELQHEVLKLQADLRDEELIKNADSRIKELETEEKKMAQAVADQEREQFVIENFTKAKIETLEKRINAKFEMVSFKMFATQINGGETETCEALIDGVPFSDANTARKLNAGIDIINTLTDYYQVYAPIFVDNRESVVRLIKPQSQLINLSVHPAYSELVVEGNEVENELQTA
jgi:exonuclease SbcC